MVGRRNGRSRGVATVTFLLILTASGIVRSDGDRMPDSNREMARLLASLAAAANIHENEYLNDARAAAMERELVRLEETGSPLSAKQDVQFRMQLFESDSSITRFRDVAPACGLDVLGLSGGSIMEDFDNDGYADIMASSWGLSDQLRYFHSNGDGTFTDKLTPLLSRVRSVVST